MSELQPGAAIPTTSYAAPYDDNAYAVAEGKLLFSQYNCVGCHAHGGGSIGPALMDEDWLYGSSPEDIYSSIAEGRPNGMPAFGEKVPSVHVWRLVSYVRSLSGQIRMDVRPGRADHMRVREPELWVDTRKPKVSRIP